MADLTTRSLSADDRDLFFDVFTAAFLDDSRDSPIERYRELFDPALAHGTFDGDEAIGVAGRFETGITLPGPVQHPVAAITAVGVKPGHRRRGALTSLMRAQLDDLRGNGSGLAALYASEASIYGRFGFGLASYESHLTLPRGAAFLSTVDVDGRRVSEVDRETALEFVHQRYPAVAATRTGWLSRADGSWEVRMIDDRSERGDLGKTRFALHPDGYVIYRPKPNWTNQGPAYHLRVLELVASTPQAYAALWRYLLDFDLVGEVHWGKAAVDEPVVGMLANSRLAERNIIDGLWVRLVDLDHALEARRYSAAVDVVFDVTDSFCPWNAGRWRLTTGADGVASVARTDDPGQMALDVSDLAAAYLGGNTLSGLARSGRVAELAPGALFEASRAFATDDAPHCPEGF
ncbi:GNAT family N-acetyltransferase [Saccharopolyspora sp. ASAGF58]|uniref:GNAT family N-acetyltransferase n=1 Tax=Saccharopolyspora sp. ASAGF58 TaxID=2719023 RepID=UPI0014400CDD|nr:GNAT family N-acetyltransferase [Saccharopolyspora sp. ASAGF58]QIZ36324.1 GNAT family N-acetyltransferase [Saccharopolyspora sp. ASAGF58]